jgi:hypothetical protein
MNAAYVLAICYYVKAVLLGNLLVLRQSSPGVSVLGDSCTDV